MENKELSFHERRKKGIGGTDISVILGENPYKSELQLYLEKTGATIGTDEPVKENKYMKWGKILEPLVAEEYRIENDIPEGELIDGGFHISKDNDIFIAHIDRLAYPKQKDKEYGVEIKTTSSHYNSVFYGQEGSDEIPEAYILQCQWYMGIYDLPFFHVPVFFSNKDLKTYIVYQDQDLINIMQSRAADWWNKYVLKGIEPPVSHHKSDAEYLRKKYINPTAEVLTINRDDLMAEKIEKYIELQKQLKEISKQNDLLKNGIIQYMGNCSILEFPNGRITYKKDKDGKDKINSEKILNECIADILTEKGEEVNPDNVNNFLAKYTVNREENWTKGRKGARKFLVKLYDENEE